MVEYSQVAYISVILLLLTLMLGYILRLVSLDLLNGFPGGVVRVSGISNHVHRINMASKDLQWTISVMSNSNSHRRNENSDLNTNSQLHLQIKIRSNIDNDDTSTTKLIYRAYWGVNITSFHQVKISPWNWFIHAFGNGNLFGSENCHQLDSMQEKEIANVVDDVINVKLSPPDDLDLGPAPRTKYPLILVSTCHQKQDVYQIHVIHIGDSMHFKTHILAHYLKWPNSKVTHIIPIYEEENCVICITNKATRVTLPCRHANLCQTCFTKLPQKKCPMCRSQMQSYFLIHPEEDDEDLVEEVIENEVVSPPLTWRQRLAEYEHRFAMAMGLQENN